MDPKNATQEEPSNIPGSRKIASQASELGALLSGSDLGVKIKGVILSGDEPTVFEGTSKSGKPYKFCQRRIQLWTGNKAVTVAQRKDNLADFGPLPVGILVEFRVGNVRVHDGQPTFDVEG